MATSPPSSEDPRIADARTLTSGPLPRFDVLLPATELTRMYHEMRRAALGLLEVIDGIADAEQDEPEPEEYDPGPEIDDEGGMSEHRHALPGDPF
jgi:hypothetical protein